MCRSLLLLLSYTRKLCEVNKVVFYVFGNVSHGSYEIVVVKPLFGRQDAVEVYAFARGNLWINWRQISLRDCLLLVLN